jgi:hypothetical protein
VIVATPSSMARSKCCQRSVNGTEARNGLMLGFLLRRW